MGTGAVGGLCGPYQGPGDAAYYRAVPRDSLIITRYDIEPGQTVEVSSSDSRVKDQWIFAGPVFTPHHCIYVGTSDMWLLEGSQAAQIPLVQKDTPLDTYRPPAPTFVNWPSFDIWNRAIEFKLQNRSDKMGHFVVRLAGDAPDPVSAPPRYPHRFGYGPGTRDPRDPRP